MLCLSSPMGLECLQRAQPLPLLDAYHEGALALDGPFGVWGAIALDRPDPDDVDRALARGCVGLSLPAGAIGGLHAVSPLRAVAARAELPGAPLPIPPGPGPRPGASGTLPDASLGDPLWWPALTRYIAEMHA